ncbi:Uncharacterized conserved protein [uncultured Roseburia sp.]|uniref:Uncharacterized protein n=1 Tax=Brotonthovivens ammoniilytica TaxID=2981725 RepID=A0ABT2THJ1_9FIRM|nr:hypothetical protein [Brotonthovivens ammoniilytica]MCU6761662.1 hypothetical protein [Brotonthovivens ammoniilytica]SCI42837.1 Uncharacterized conserved protein [uncultured Roseburia sp.]
MEAFTENVKKVLLAGVGAAATAVEKTQEVTEELIKKGKSLVEEGKAANEELKRDAKVKVKSKVKEALNLDDEITDSESLEEILKQLTPLERQVIREKLDILEREETDDKKVSDEDEQKKEEEQTAQ